MPINLFNANFYRATNADLATFSDAQAVSHFQSYGLNEGRTFSPFVNLNFYRSSNPDLAGFNNRQAFDHLQTYGVAEGRRFSALVDLNFYRGNNGDLGGFNNEQILEHLRSDGVAEGRRFSQFADLNLYRAANNDLNAAGYNNRQLLEHLSSYGVAEGRRFSVSFDSNYYRNTYSDLAAAGLNNTQLLEHFEFYGLSEGRASSESFNVSYYLANNADLKAAGFNNQQAEQHFELYGFRERRLAAASAQGFLQVDPGNNLGNAFSLDVLNGKRSVKEFVGSADRDDYYRFTLASASNLNISLNGLSSNANVQLIYDSNGNGQYESNEGLYTTYASSSNSGAINPTLGAGTYFIRVYTDNPSYNTNYTLRLSVTTIPYTTPRDPGNTLSSALDIGTVSSNANIKDFVGSADRDDYYRFTLASTSNLNISFNGLSDYANVQLIYDSNGNGQYKSNERLSSTSASSSYSGAINSTLGAGTYFIRVYTDYFSYNTNYTLGLSATNIPATTPRDPGNTLGSSLDIGTLSGTHSFNDFVGSADQNDYYRFNLATTSNFNLSLNGLSDSANVQLIYDSNSNGLVDSYDTLKQGYGYKDNNASINSFLGAGIYFVRVNADSYDNTNYTLSLSA